MTDVRRAPRTLEYLILRTCERLGLLEREFYAQSYPAQLRQLAYSALRTDEEQGPMETDA